MLRSAYTSILVWALLLGSARAQDDSQKKAAANTLFDEGRKLLAAGDVASACAKFEASIAALPQLGTRLNLATCYERLGRLASAWAEFREAASLAGKRVEADREALARARIAALEPRLSRMVIKLAKDARTVELRVTRDDVVILPALLDTAVPVDPGKHIVAAIAPGYKPWRVEVTVAGEQQRVTVEVPALVPLPQEEAAAAAGLPSLADAAHRRKVYRIAAVTAGAAGLVAVGVGAYFGLKAKSNWDDSKSHCDANTVCDQTGVDLVHDAQSAGTISTLAFGAGAAALVTGVILYFTAPSVPEVSTERARLEIHPLIGEPGLLVRYRF